MACYCPKTAEEKRKKQAVSSVASSAAGTINRIIDVFPNTQQDQIRTQLASSILGILCQTLLPILMIIF